MMVWAVLFNLDSVLYDASDAVLSDSKNESDRTPVDCLSAPATHSSWSERCWPTESVNPSCSRAFYRYVTFARFFPGTSHHASPKRPHKNGILVRQPAWDGADWDVASCPNPLRFDIQIVCTRSSSQSNVVTGIRKKLRNWLGSRSRNTGSSLAKAPVLFRAIMCGLAHSLPTLVLRCFRRRSAMEITAKAASPSLDSCFFDIGAIFSY